MAKKINIPKKGFESWFYKKIPGSVATKRKILISTIFLLYIVSFLIFLITNYNTVSADNPKNFADRVANTKLK